MMDSVSFVQSLELFEHRPLALSVQQLAPSAALLQQSDKPEGLVVGGSLVSFTAALQGQQKEDVLNGTLLAQLASDKKHDRYKDSENWYKMYSTVMEQIGWVVQNLKFDEYHGTQSDFRISEVVLELLSSVLGEDKEMMNIVKETLDNLKKSSDGVSLFGSNSSSGDHGNFQIVPCQVDKSNQVNIALVGSYFKASEVSHNYLFVTVKKETIDLFKAATICTLNEDQYGRVRQTIKDKLGDRAKDFIKNLDI